MEKKYGEIFIEKEEVKNDEGEEIKAKKENKVVKEKSEKGLK